MSSLGGECLLRGEGGVFFRRGGRIFLMGEGVSSLEERRGDLLNGEGGVFFRRRGIFLRGEGGRLL